ncbi:MAG: DUF1513 domain-containing protein [Rhizobiaceae bacterium]|nr:DUF1513 domain-containing protein [Rhizobiaceae bacterium]
MRALIDRRDFLRAAGTAFVAGLSGRALAATLDADAVFATACQNRSGTFGVAILSEAGAVLSVVDLPERGHDVTFDPVSRRSVVFARRPGTFAVIFDHAGLSAPQTITSPAGRHYFGHGLFAPDGRLLYATENDFDNAAGMVGVYDATDGFRRIAEFPTYGMDPHEMVLLADGRTLAIANGGIETHPDFGRAKLNLSTMQPSLVFIDRESGSLIEKHELPQDLHQLSIRHMDVSGDGTLWFGCQYEGPAIDRPSLIGRARRGEPLALVDMPDDALGSLRNYVGSVAANPSAGTLAVASPQGNSLVVLDAATGTIVSVRTMVEVCGIAGDGAGYFATTGKGMVAPASHAAVNSADHVWDNHVLRIA